MTNKKKYFIYKGATNIYKIAYNAINKKKDQFIYQEARILHLL